MVEKRVEEKYLAFDFMKKHPDYKKDNWFGKYMEYNFAEIYVDEHGCDEYVFRSDLYVLKEYVKDNNYNYEKFKEIINEYDTERQIKHISWLCALDNKVQFLKNRYETEYEQKVPTLHWKKLEKYYKNETIYQKQIYDFRCSSHDNDMYFLDYVKELDKCFAEAEKTKTNNRSSMKKNKDRER